MCEVKDQSSSDFKEESFLEYFDMSIPFDRAIRKPDPVRFTYQQKEDLERLWKTQTFDSQDDGNVPDQMKPISNDCMSYLMRLHGFIFAFLKKHSGNNKDEDDLTFHLKDALQESSLEPFYSTFVDRSEEREASHGGTIRLNGEKLVIMLNHENFLFELNEYEYKGQFRIDDRSCVNNCYGAYLYHHPLDALPALNVAMALAVISLWRIRNHSFSGIRTTGSANEASKVGQFLDCCRINVRFVHVSPQLPMADIKTGLLKKLIAVKGHVVKASSRRLRVSTADL